MATSNQKPDGGPAFPLPIAEINGRGTNSAELGYGMSGMTLRDWFAGKALESFEGSTRGVVIGTAEREAQNCARAAYLIADAMLKAREE